MPLREGDRGQFSGIGRSPRPTTYAKMLNGISTMMDEAIKTGHEYIFDAFSRASKSWRSPRNLGCSCWESGACGRNHCSVSGEQLGDSLDYLQPRPQP